MEIKIYTMPACSWCIKVKEWLETKKIAYQEIDLTESDKGRDRIIEISGQMSVPVLDIEGEIVVGFNEAKIEAAIKSAEGKGKEKE